MTISNLYSGRVIDLDAGNQKVVMVIGDRQHEIAWVGALPQLGDVYAVTLSPELAVLEILSKGRPNTSIQQGDAMRWRKADAQGHTRMATLQKRHLIKRAVREYLHTEGFIEIDMPLLVKGTTPDVEIQSFNVDGRYLVTSTEYQIKRMEIGGFDRCYTLTQNYRQGDTGRYRNPEFTMLEWARVGASLSDIEADMEQMLWQAHQALGGGEVLIYQGKTIDLRPPFERMTIKQAVQQVTSLVLDDFSAPSCLKAIEAAKLNIKGIKPDDAPHLFSVLIDYIQAHLGQQKPVFLHEWPNFQTSSALDDASGQYTERSELIIAGVELSDGFPSLTDAERQKDNFVRQQQRREHEGKETVELDQAYLSAMEEGFPRGAGMALGFDRLVMVLTDQPNLAAVLAYQWDEL